MTVKLFVQAILKFLLGVLLVGVLIFLPAVSITLMERDIHTTSNLVTILFIVKTACFYIHIFKY